MNSIIHSVVVGVAYAACTFNAAAASSANHLRADRSLALEEEAILGFGNTCPSGYNKISTKNECKEIGKFNGASHGWEGTENEDSWPSGCYHCSNVNGCIDGTWFNNHSTGQANAGATPWCLKSSGGGPPTPPPTSVAGKIMFAGDSDIEYWNTASPFPGSSNVGVGGWTCKNVLNKIDDHLDQWRPDVVVLVCGENDLWSASVDVTFQRFESVVAKITNFGARVLYLGTKPEPATKSLHAEYQQYDAKIRALASASATTTTASNQPLLTMVDVYQSFEATGNSNDLYDRDGLHLSQEGYELWTKWAKQALNDFSGCFEWLSETCVAITSGVGGGPPATLVEKQVIACGKNGGCGNTGEDLIDKEDEAYVRCCSDNLITGWSWKQRCDIYTESNAWGQCSGLVSFAAAESICVNENARLCTKDELINNCAKGTGCKYDRKMIWTSSTDFVEV